MKLTSSILGEGARDRLLEGPLALQHQRSRATAGPLVQVEEPGRRWKGGAASWRRYPLWSHLCDQVPLKK